MVAEAALRNPRLVTLPERLAENFGGAQPGPEYQPPTSTEAQGTGMWLGPNAQRAYSDLMQRLGGEGSPPGSAVWLPIRSPFSEPLSLYGGIAENVADNGLATQALQQVNPVYRPLEELALKKDVWSGKPLDLSPSEMAARWIPPMVLGPGPLGAANRLGFALSGGATDPARARPGILGPSRDYSALPGNQSATALLRWLTRYGPSQVLPSSRLDNYSYGPLLQQALDEQRSALGLDKKIGLGAYRSP
jgi:hypothetical protein